jgi:hypothetical protein
VPPRTGAVQIDRHENKERPTPQGDQLKSRKSQRRQATNQNQPGEKQENLNAVRQNNQYQTSKNPGT